MIFASGILIFLSYFYFDLEEGTSGISVLPDEEPVKIGFELLNEKFGFGQDAPTLIAVDADTNSETISQSLIKLEKGISDYSGMNPPQLTIYNEVSYAEFLASIPGDPNGQDAVNSIKYLRNTLIPNAFDGVDPAEEAASIRLQAAVRGRAVAWRGNGKRTRSWVRCRFSGTCAGTARGSCRRSVG